MVSSAPSGTRCIAVRYGLALLCAAASVPAIALLAGPFGEVFFFPALVGIAALALYHGTGPGLLASVLVSAGVDILVFEPTGSLLVQDSADLVRIGGFLASGVLISILAGTQHSSRLRIRAQAIELEAVLDAVPAAVFMARDPGAQQIESNRFAGELLGAVPATARNPARAYRTLHAGVDIPPDERPVHVAARLGLELRDYEMDVVFPDGTTRHVLGNASPLRDDHGAVRGGVSAFVDITERKRAEAAVSEADRRKEEFLAVLSHELRNPLAPIRNSLYIMDHVPPGGVQAAHARTVIERQVAHMSRLIDDLLDVSRISRGKIRIQRQPIELGDLLRRTLEDHRPVFAEGGLVLEANLCATPMWVDGDPTRLAQVAGNLLHNAAKFTPEGGRVNVSAGIEDGWAVLRVGDSGIGIEPHLLDSIFDPFIQAERAIDRSRGGLGLGLALVRGIVSLHGGEALARSAGAGRGSEFTVRLPLTEPVQGDGPAPSGAAREGARRVLVIEDNLDSAATLKELLELTGHVATVAHSGPDGIARAREFGPDFVLCDIGLPGMDGYEVARALRADPVLGKITLAALTGYAMPEDRRRAAEAGFDEHLTKPLQLDRLKALLAGAPCSLRGAHETAHVIWGSGLSR